jgi:uncharacterized protein YcbK (DUF882 family)
MKLLGHGVVVTEGFRSAANHQLLMQSYKAGLGARPAATSWHRKGKALDIRANGDKRLQDNILCAASKCGFVWAKRYPKPQGHVHIDMRPGEGPQGALPDPCKCKIH